MIEEQEKDLKQQKQEGQMVEEMTSSRGWREIVLPSIEARIEYRTNQLLESESVNSMVGCQQQIIALKDLLKFIDNIKIMGKQAEEALENERASARDSIVNAKSG